MQTIVIYSSQTGNTRKLATQIFAAIPGDSKDLKNIDEYREKDAELYFVGFWVDRGDCDEKTVELLSGLHGKKIALFGTCGMGNDPAYYQKVIDRVKTWIPEDNEYMDAFLCQGKMPIQVRRRYEEMAKSGQNTEQIQAMIRNFDRAMLHPRQQILRYRSGNGSDHDVQSNVQRRLVPQNTRIIFLHVKCKNPHCF